MIGEKIEAGIELFMSLSTEVANIQSQLASAKDELAMFSMLYDINQYMGTNSDIDKLIPLIEDVVIGTVGANYCAVILDDSSSKKGNKFGLKFSYADLIKENVNNIFIENLTDNQLYGLNEGSLYIHKMDFADGTCGYIIVYWTITCTANDTKVKFLNILSTQTGLSIKSARLVEKFKLLAIHDPLTGIYNRSYFNNIESTTNPVIGECMVMFDIDDFKKVNDTKGHPFGDVILKTFANILKECADNEGAICFKYGGEEFVLGYKGGEDKGLKLANKIRKRFQKETGITVSGGLATIGESCKVNNYKSLLSLADASLYVSKQCGKNKITVSSSDLQLFSVAGQDLCALLSQAYRTSITSNIIRLDVQSKCTIPPEELLEFDSILRSILRKSDIVHVAECLSALIIVDNKLNTNEVMSRIEQLMAKGYPQFEYKLFICNNVFNEVIMHSSRIAEMAQTFGTYLGIETDDLSLMRLASDWHDVGKLCISPDIYSKPGKLTEYEFSRIKHHAWLGYSMAKQDQNLKQCAEWILKHHEDYNGKGYYGFKEGEIPLQAQVLSLIDKFDALTEDRCYRKAYTWEEALDILRSESGKFEPTLFRKFETCITTVYTDKKYI